MKFCVDLKGESREHIFACTWWRRWLPARGDHQGESLCFAMKDRQVVDLMKRNKDVGAACGRIHPTGSGYMQWWANWQIICETQFHCVIGQVPEVWVCHRTLASEGNRTHAWLCSLQVEIILKCFPLSWPWPSARDVSLCSEPRQWWTRMWCTPTPLLPASQSTLSSTTR